MAQHYRIETAQNGNVADPTWWIRCIQEFQNGWQFLDRDNLTESCVTEAMIRDESFTYTASDQKTDTITLDKTSLSWQNTDVSTGDTLHNLSVTCDVDCLLIVEWSGTYKWTGTLTWTSPTQDAFMARVTVDGIEVASSGWLGDGRQWGSLFLVGAIPVSAGVRPVKLEVLMANIDYTQSSPTIETSCTDVLTLINRNLTVRLRKR